MKILKAARPVVFLTACIVLLMLVSAVTSDAATASVEPFNINVNGQSIETDAQPLLENDRILVPVATIVKYLGGTADWNGDKQQVTLVCNDVRVLLTIGSKTVRVGSVNKTIDVAPKIQTIDSNGGGRTMVPLRFLSESFGYKVAWDNNTRTATVLTGNSTSTSSSSSSSSSSASQGTASSSTSGTSSGTAAAANIKIDKAIVTGAQKGSDGAKYTIVTITSNKSMAKAVEKGVSLKSPDRFYIDIKGATTTTGKDYAAVSFSGSKSYVTGVRIGTHSDAGQFVRVVVDLSGAAAPTYYLNETGTTLFIAFPETATATAAGTSSGSGSTSGSGTSQSGTDASTSATSSTSPAEGTTITEEEYKPYADGKLVVCIDPGHDASTPGKKSPDESLKEWEFNRDVAYRLKALLEAQGVEVVMTVGRWEDQGDESSTTLARAKLAKRVAVANNYKSDVDLFVSVHANAFSSDGGWSSAEGWEIYTFNTGTVAEKAAKYIEKATKATGIVKDRGRKTANFYVIKYTEMPAVLIEHAFFTNYEECQKMKTDSFRQTLAQADCTGIMNFFASFK